MAYAIKHRRERMAEYMRKKRANMTPEQREEYLAKCREYDRRRKKSPESKAKQLEWQRAKRATPEGRRRYLEQARKRRQNPDTKAKIKACHRRRMYKLTPEQLEFVMTHTTCECCGDPAVGRNQHVDHDHKTGHFRGVLCHYCNLAEGALKSDPVRAIRLFEYMLSRSRT